MASSGSTAWPIAASGPPPLTPARGWERQGRLTSIELLVVGSAAGAGAKTVTAPLDRIRLIYQVSPHSTFNLRGSMDLAQHICRSVGASGLWRGHSATLWRVMPFAGVQFATYDAARYWLTIMEVVPREYTPASAGAVAASTATIVTYPLDVLRTRMVSHVGPKPRYRGFLAAVEETLRKEGPQAFCRGLGPSLLGVAPYGAVSFGTFELLKRQMRARHGADADVPVIERLAAGAFSGACSQVLVYPLSVVRRRMQAGADPLEKAFRSLDKDGSGDLCRREVEPLAQALKVPASVLFQRLDADRSGRLDLSEFRAYRGTLEAIRRISGEEGLLGGLYKGASLTWIKGPATVGLAFVINDLLKAFIERRGAVHEGDQYAPLTGGGHLAAGTGAVHKLNAIESLACGGLAGAAAKTVIAPGDRIKILFQTSSSRSFSWRAAVQTGKDIVVHEGGRGLWRGHSATLLRVVPFSATSFATFDPYKAWLREGLPQLSDPAVRFLAGAGAGMTATTLTYPLDVFRARMAASEEKFEGYIRSVRRIVRKEGALSLWCGLRPTLLGIVPYSGMSYCMFETFKARLLERQRLGGSENPSLPVHERLGAGAVAGLLAQSATYPLDVVRRRMQVDPRGHPNEVAALRKILSAEGLAGLFKGLTINWIKGPLAISISFCANDALRSRVATLRAGPGTQPR